MPGINLFILFPHLEVNAWQVRLLLSYLYLHLHLPLIDGRIVDVELSIDDVRWRLIRGKLSIAQEHSLHL